MANLRAIAGMIALGALGVTIWAPGGSARAAPVPVAVPVSAPAGASYGEAQAKRGQLNYIRHCARCHGADLNGAGLTVPPLRARFIRHWSGGMDDVVDYIQRAMPLEKPGTLDRPTALSITAYLLRENGYPAGVADLPESPDELAKITLKPIPAGRK